MNARALLSLWLIAGALVAGALGQAPAPVKPLGEADLASLLGLGLDDETIVARIKKGGLAFDLTDAAVQKLKSAGASEAVVKALQAAAQANSQPTSAASAITYDQVLQLLGLGLDEESVLKRLAKSPTVFTLDAAQTEALKKAGATPKILEALTGVRAAPAGGDVTDLALILDCSGSMSQATTGGETKMTAAKRVLTDLVGKIPAGLNVTFVIYGHEVYGGAEDPRNCQAVKVVRPLAPLDEAGRTALVTTIAALKPTGATPIALSLRTAGEELAKNKSMCGLVLVTDGIESCKGDPAAEAAALVAKLNVSFGVNVVGFGVKPEENAALKEIAVAGKGKYYGAADSKELTDAISTIAKQIQDNAEIVDTTRRALRVLTPKKVQMPPVEEIYIVRNEEADSPIATKIGSVEKFDDYLSIPSSTNKYAVFFQAKDGWAAVPLLRNFSIPDRRVVDVKPESILGMVQVNGTGKTERIYIRKPGDRGQVNPPVQLAEKFGDVMVVPAGKYDIYVGNSLIEEDFEVKPGTLHRLK